MITCFLQTFTQLLQPEYYMKKFQNFLLTRISDSLPGLEAQKIMAPSPLKGTNSLRNYTPEDRKFRSSSVLVPIKNWEEEPEIVLTLRVKSINHGGQISFPGGGREGNETVIETALREAQEEIGLINEGVEIVGELTPLYVGHSDNMITPVLAFLNTKQTFTPNPNEVEEIFSVSLSDLAKKAHLTDEEWDLRGISYKVPFWNIHRVPLWGATAMILSELLVLYSEFLEKEFSNDND